MSILQKLKVDAADVHGLREGCLPWFKQTKTATQAVRFAKRWAVFALLAPLLSMIMHHARFSA